MIEQEQQPNCAPGTEALVHVADEKPRSRRAYERSGSDDRSGFGAPADRTTGTSEHALLRHRGLRRFLAVTLLGCVALALLGVLLRIFDGWRAVAILTLIGLAAGTLAAEVHLTAARSFRKSAFAGLGVVVVSQVCYLLLVWTGWTAESMLWRVWWISTAVTIASTHTLLLRLASGGRRDWIESGTLACAGVLGLMLAWLALYRDFPPSPTIVHIWVLVISAAGSLVGSYVMWFRWMHREALPAAASRGAKLTWLLLSHTVLLLLGWFAGRAALSQPSPFDALPAALANLSPRQLNIQLRGDLARLRTIATGVDSLAHQTEDFASRLAVRLEAEGRDYYLPEEDDQIRSLFMTHLSYRAALLRLVATYAGFEVVLDPTDRARSFMVGYAAAMTTARSSVHLIERYRDQPLARRTLNEPAREWRTPAGMFDRIYESVIDRRNVELVADMAAYFDLNRSKWREENLWYSRDFDWLESRIVSGLAYLRQNRIDDEQPWIESFLERMRDDAAAPVYSATSSVIEWIGDTRIVKRPDIIGPDRIREIEPRLRPGDILLGRRNWYLSNALLPGFWSHAALYVGRMDDLKRLGIADHPTIQEYLEPYRKPTSDGRDRTVIEALSEGVVFSSLTDSMHGDYVAVLRPRLLDAEIADAIVRAFRHHGKPYDFDFDFRTADRLVCTEVIYRAYEGMLHFDLVRVLARDTVPATDIVRKFARERDSTERQLDFVLFLDANKKTGQAELASEERFIASADRPGAFDE